jgi:hypothetical protein
VWKTSGARIFLKASPALQQAHFAIGVVVLLVSFLLVWWTELYSAEIFPSSVSTDDAAAPRGSSTSTAATEPTAL